MPLPFFLGPLLLVSYYYDRLIQRLTGWVTRSNEQLFGPLEQGVAAIVIIGLAMQSPPAFLLPPLPAPSVPPTVIFNASFPPPGTDRRPSIPPPPSDPRALTPGEMGDGPNDSSLDVNPINIVIILLSLNLAAMMIPDELRGRFRQSWDLFWPPWQDRLKSEKASSPSSSTTTSKSKDSGTEGMTFASSSRRVAIVDPKDEGRSKRSETERARATKDVVATSTKERVPESFKDAKERSSSSSSDKNEVGLRTKSSSSPSDKEPKSAEKEKEMMQAPKEKLDAQGKLTQSERARRAKDSSTEAKAKKPEDAESLSTEKGKGRMEGERLPNPGSSSSKPASVGNCKDKPTSTSPSASASKTSSNSKPKKNDDGSGIEGESVATSNTTSGASASETEDELMAGDYRPLKSALKKSKKKPRQSKNIHHNYFMTMRGWRPALIPFPHGFHPKPHHPRNSLWWDNIPRNADHIMAPPPVAKKPEEGGEEEDRENGTDKDKEKDNVKDKDKKKDDKDKVKFKPEEGDDTKKKEKSGDKTTDPKEAEKEKEQAKLKAAAEAQAAAAKSSSSKSPVSSSEPASDPVNPQVQKATFIAQGMLCILLWYIHEQLGLLLLTFFVWQLINEHNEVATRLLSSKASATTTTTSAHPSTSSRNSSATLETKSDHKEGTDPSTNAPPKEAGRSRDPEAKEDAARIPKEESKAQADDKRTSATPKSSHADPAALTTQQKVEDLEKMIKKLRSAPDPTPELKDKLKRAMLKRQQLLVDTGPSKSIAKPPTEPSDVKETIEPTNKANADTGRHASKDDRVTKVVELEKKAKEMDDYVRKLRSVDNSTEEQRSKLVKAEEKRRALWKELRSQMSSNGKPDTHPPNVRELSGDKRAELKAKLKEIEAYVLRYRKVENPTTEQKEKLARADDKRRAVKKELVAIEQKLESGVGGSGLSIEEKEDL